MVHAHLPSYCTGRIDGIGLVRPTCAPILCPRVGRWRFSIRSEQHQGTTERNIPATSIMSAAELPVVGGLFLQRERVPTLDGLRRDNTRHKYIQYPNDRRSCQGYHTTRQPSPSLSDDDPTRFQARRARVPGAEHLDSRQERGTDDRSYTVRQAAFYKIPGIEGG